MDNNSFLFEPLPKGPISEIIVQRITDALITGELKPSDKIPTEQNFSERLGVGRNAVREAIKVLIAFGVLEIRRSEGTYVVDQYHQNLINPLLYGLPLVDKSVAEILEFKLSVYQSLLYWAVANATKNEIKTLRSLCDSFYRISSQPFVNVQEMLLASEAYNTYLGNITHNPLIISLNEITMRFSRYTRVKAIEVSIELGTPTLLPHSYYKDFTILENCDVPSILPLLEHRMEIWKKLIL